MLRNIFICNLFRDGSLCEAETQCNFSNRPQLFAPMKRLADKSCGTNIDRVSQGVGTNLDCDKHFNNQAGFCGFLTIKKEQDLLDLAGVTFSAFQLLLKALNDWTSSCISKENRLLIFLFKMKLGLTFSALVVLFGVHRTTISRVFQSCLAYLAKSCANFIQWPSRFIIDATMPIFFKETYSRCQAIIDCTEFRIEEPPEIPDRVLFYSNYKKGYTIKVLVACLPAGEITYISKCFGGRTSDPQITVKSGFLELLEAGDLIMADKGFPQIKTVLDQCGKEILLVMPPFLRNGTFSAEEVSETQKIAGVRIHIERIMQRIKTLRITSKFAVSQFAYADDIVFMTGVLVNLQRSIIKIDDNSE